MPYSAGYAIADVNALKALLAADLVNGYARLVISKGDWYGWDSGSTAIGDDDSVVEVASLPATGRFIRSIASQTTAPPSLARNTVAIVTSTLANAQIENIDVALGKSFDLYRITTNFPAWIRVYYTSADRTLDSGRSDTVNVQDYNSTIKIIHEVFTSVSLPSVYLNPVRRGASYEPAPSSNIAVAIKNISGSTRQINLSFTKLTLEN